MKFTDRANIGKVKRTSEGYLSTQARAIRTGIQEYYAWEFGDTVIADGFDENDIVRVNRPEESVFSKDSLRSAVHIPVTVNHPDVWIDSENYSEYSVGEVSTDVMRDGEFVAFSIMVKDKRGLDAIESGMTELSAGYTAELVRVDHKDYDYVMGKPHFNHLAIVDKARAGHEARIGDNAAKPWGAAPLTKTEKEPKMVDMKTVVVGDKAVQVAASDADIITAMQKDHAKALADKDKEIADRDAAIGEKMGEIENLKKSALTDADVEAKAVERAATIDKAMKIVDGLKPEGKTVGAIRREALSQIYDAEKVKEFPDAAVDAMFDVLDVTKQPDPVRAAAADAVKQNPKGTSAWDGIIKTKGDK